MRKDVKILLIVYFIVISYILYYDVTNQLNIQRFEGIFVGFINMYLNGRITINNILLMPLFNNQIPLDSSLSVKAQNIIITDSYFPNFSMLFLILYNFTNIPPELLITLPLGVIFIPIAYMATINTYSNNDRKVISVISFLTIIFYIIYSMSTRLYGSFYVAPPSILLVLIIFLCIKKIIDNSKNIKSYYFIFVVCLFSLVQYWHSAFMDSLFFILSVFSILVIINIITHLTNKQVGIYEIWKYNKYITRFMPIVIIAIVIALTFSHLWQTTYVTQFITSAGAGQFFTNIINQFFGKNPFSLPYDYNYKDLFWGKIYFYSLLIIMMLSSINLILPIFINVLTIINEKRLCLNRQIIFSIAIILSTIMFAFAYYKSDSLAFPEVTYYFPIFAASSIIFIKPNYRNVKKLVVVNLVIMILLAFVLQISLDLTNNAGMNSPTSYIDTEYNFKWLNNNINKDKPVVVDFNILGLYIQRESQLTKPTINYIDLSPDIYGVLVGDKNINTMLSTGYAVIDYYTMQNGLPVHVEAGRSMLYPEYEKINASTNQNKLYMDNKVAVYQFINA